jgi:hypothetical protein
VGSATHWPAPASRANRLSCAAGATHLAWLVASVRGRPHGGKSGNLQARYAHELRNPHQERPDCRPSRSANDAGRWRWRPRGVRRDCRRAPGPERLRRWRRRWHVGDQSGGPLHLSKRPLPHQRIGGAYRGRRAEAASGRLDAPDRSHRITNRAPFRPPQPLRSARLPSRRLRAVVAAAPARDRAWRVRRRRPPPAAGRRRCGHWRGR